MVRNPLARNPLACHAALFLAVKAALIALGLWWFLGTMPEPRGTVTPPAAAGTP
ncbi:hypothetical protein [Azospirillum brasilense]|uniref:hypothetical protein n=1 Tax=Azospirillum brasilense TaxID=192 RepID=UPI001585E3CF|nr:hypothetical protein [Azospirillum brasilense]